MLIASVNQDAGIGSDSRKGAAVHVASMRRAFAEHGCSVLELDQKDAAALRAALERAHACGPLDLVYERYALGCDVASRFAREHDVPFVLEVNAPLLDEARAHRGRASSDADEVLEGEIFRSARRVLAVSRLVADSVRARGVSPARVLVRANAVDSARFVPRPRPADGPLVLGFHGRLRPWHGFERLVDCVGILLARGVDVRLDVVGEGDFDTLVTGRLPPGCVRLHGWTSHEQMPAHVARFDVLLLTYPPDAPCYFSPLKLLEAMAVGAVPVVPALGDLPCVVRDGVDGLLYPADDLVAAVERVAALAADPRLRRRLSENAVATARRRSWTSLAREVLRCVHGRTRA